MWVYEKKLQYPVKIARPNAKLAKVIISQLGGPDFMFFQLQPVLQHAMTAIG